LEIPWAGIEERRLVRPFAPRDDARCRLQDRLPTIRIRQVRVTRRSGWFVWNYDTWKLKMERISRLEIIASKLIFDSCTVNHAGFDSDVASPTEKPACIEMWDLPERIYSSWNSSTTFLCEKLRSQCLWRTFRLKAGLPC